jgi:hypothetical protein
MPRFSLLLPCPQPSPAFEDTLASLLRTRPQAAEVIVIHDGTYRDEYGLAGEVDYATAGSRRLVAFWNAGIDQAVGEFIVWLQPGAQLEDGWEEDCLAAFENPQVGSVGPSLRVERGGRVACVRGLATSATGTRQVRTSARRELLGPTRWAAAYRQSALGWIDPVDLVWEDEYLDVYLALNLQRLGYQYQLAENWDVLVDGISASEVLQPRAHGLSAARAAQRFGGPLKAGAAGLREDLPRLVSESWRWKHLRGRWKARRFRSADQHAGQQLLELAARRQQILAKQTGQANRRAA